MRHQPSLEKVLMVRMDRIGDLILSLPVDQLPGFAYSSVTWLLQDGMEFIPANAVPQRRFIAWDRRFQFAKLYQLWKLLRQEKFTAVFIFHAPWWLSAVCAFAGIPFRAGVRSQWHSYVFLTRGIRQKRSHALYHESEYNRRLVQQAMDWNTSEPLPGSLVIQHDTNIERLKSFGLENKKYLVVHPGMAGSARNWTPPLYAEFIEELAKNETVVVTGSPSDQRMVEQVRKHVNNKNVKWLVISQAEDWLNVLSGARAVVAPSTGTIHVSSSLGIPVLGIYCPVKVQAPKRWAPLGKLVELVVPQVECPGHMKCLMESCPRFDCMRDVTVEEVRAGLGKLLARGS